MPLAASTLPPHLQFREARRRAGLTQAALAAQAGCMQSAVSMMEGGRMAALARPTLEKIAGILGIDLPPEAGVQATSGPVPIGGTSLCPNPECPSNLPYYVGEEVFFLPRGGTGSGRHCPLCGEVLATDCPSCGARVRPFAACCTDCGKPLVIPPPEPVPDLRTWVSARQRQAQLLAGWPVDVPAPEVVGG